MSAKLGKASKLGKEVVKKVIRASYVDMNIPAGGASVGPPLGPILGEYGLPINKFVQDFNEATKEIKTGIPMPTRIHIDGKKYRIQVYEPCVKFLIRQAAGITKPSPNPSKIVGKITLMHVYEIARVKIEQEDYKIRDYTMKMMCELVASQCYELGVQIVPHLDADEYQEFLETQKREEEEKQRAEEAALLEARKKAARKLAN